MESIINMKERKLRIVYLSSACIPSRTANSIHVMKMSQALARVGHDVNLIAPDQQKGREQYPGNVWHYYGVEQGFEIAFGPWLSMKGRGYWYGWQAARMALRWGADIVYGRNLAACTFAALRGMPVVFETHSPVEDDGPLAHFLFRRLLKARAFSHLVVITEALARHYAEKWPELRGRINVAPDGADPLPDTLQPVNLQTDGERLQVGYTGHLYHGKGAEHVLAVAQACPEFDFHLVGGTERDLARWQERTDLPDNLTLHGYRPHAEIPAYLIAFDVVLLPNQLEVHSCGGSQDIGRWTSPLKLFEYMAARRAIICSDVPVLQEIADHEVNMLVCRHDSAEDWAVALRRLARDTQLRERLGAEARTQLEARYSWQARAQRVI